MSDEAQAPQTRGRSVLQFQSASAGGAKFASFDDDTGEARRTVMLDFDEWDDMGRPDTLTVTYDPGDKLNDEDRTQPVAAGDARVREPAAPESKSLGDLKANDEAPPSTSVADPAAPAFEGVDYYPGRRAQEESQAGDPEDPGVVPIPQGGAPTEDPNVTEIPHKPVYPEDQVPPEGVEFKGDGTATTSTTGPAIAAPKEGEPENAPPAGEVDASDVGKGTQSSPDGLLDASGDPAAARTAPLDDETAVVGGGVEVPAADPEHPTTAEVVEATGMAPSDLPPVPSASEPEDRASEVVPGSDEEQAPAPDPGYSIENAVDPVEVEVPQNLQPDPNEQPQPETNLGMDTADPDAPVYQPEGQAFSDDTGDADTPVPYEIPEGEAPASVPPEEQPDTAPAPDSTGAETSAPEAEPKE